jgi:glycosyltransferase involved in cell wall biosynthesis
VISLVMAAYNRAHTLPRALDSVIAQDWTDWEVVVVDDGSADDTVAVVGRYAAEARIKLVRHDRNRGVTAAKNTGFDHCAGEWIGALDSDDELAPGALSALMAVLRDVDPTLDAIGCNCVDSRTGALSGRGWERDRYIDLRASLQDIRGEFWGIFRASLLGRSRFDERIAGREAVLWSRIYEGARWYYLHRGLRIYHTEGDDRLTSRRLSNLRANPRQYRSFVVLTEEATDYLDKLRRWSPRQYGDVMGAAAKQFLASGDVRRTARALGRSIEGYGLAALSRLRRPA